MSIEFIGYVGNYRSSETVARSGPVVDRPYIEALATAQEYGGFDRVLLAFHSTSPESLLVAQHVASVTRDLKLMIAHRPGFTAPTLAARQLATLDHLTGGGRIGVHIITGGDDAELAQDGDHLTKDERYARTSEYLDIVRREWTATEPFDYEGKYYRVTRGFSDVKPIRSPIPVYFGGASDAAIQVAGRHADIYALWGETHAQVRELVSRVRNAAAAHGRKPRFRLSLRPVLADTEEAAWAKADRILEQAKALNGETGIVRKAAGPENEGSKRLLQAAAQGTRLDKRLWTALAALTGAKGNSTSLVGTPDQVADAILDYYDLGVTSILIRGFDPIPDAVQYGQELIPRVRALVAERASQRAVA